MSVQTGDTIKVEYTGKLEDGTIFDSSDNHDEPLTFKVGSGQLIKGFDQGVVGMELGEEKTLTIPPEHAYGDYNSELIQQVPRNLFPEGAELHKGMMFLCAVQDGRQVPARIQEYDDSNVTLDFNPPLAGKTLIFTVKLLEIVEDQKTDNE